MPLPGVVTANSSDSIWREGEGNTGGKRGLNEINWRRTSMMWITELSIKGMVPMQMFLFNLIILHGTGMAADSTGCRSILSAYRHVPTDWANTLHPPAAPGDHLGPTTAALLTAGGASTPNPTIPAMVLPSSHLSCPQLQPSFLPKCPDKDSHVSCLSTQGSLGALISFSASSPGRGAVLEQSGAVTGP